MARKYCRSEEVIDGTVNHLEKAKQTALSLTNTNGMDVQSIFDSNSLTIVEKGIKSFADMADKCWLLSSIMLYSLIYDKQLYAQSGLTWQEYVADARNRIGMSKDDISRSLNSAQFFINHHHDLVNAGWTPRGSSFKLAYGESALELSGSLKETIQHIANDSWRDFYSWYKSFKNVAQIEVDDVRPDIEITKDNIRVNGKEAITISDELPQADRERLQQCLEQIFSAIKRGDYPAIVPVYDEKEARNLVNLRDKYRQKK